MSSLVAPVLALALILAPAEGSAQAEGASLLDLYHQAIATHPSLIAQQGALDRANARHDFARSRLLPQAAATLSYARNDFHGKVEQPDTYNTHRHSLNLRQALFDVPSARQIDAEARRVGQSEQEFDAMRTDVASELLDRVLAVLDASEELVVVQSEKEAVGGQRAQLHRMAERQMAKVTDRLEADARYAVLEAKEIEARNAVLTALEDLRESTGLEVDVLNPLSATNLPPLTDDLDAWVARGMERSPKLAAAREAIEAETRGVESARAEHLPKIALTAGKTWADSDSDSRRNEAFNVLSVGVQLNIPIYEGGRTQAGVREALARQLVAQAQFEQTRREIEREVRSAWLKAEGGRQRIDASRQSVEAQELARQAQQRGFELGVVTVVDLLDAQHRLYRARGDHARARHDYLRELATLHRYAGALNEDDMAAFSAYFSAEPRRLR
ncbi:TolC family outer membrane protein [Azoarcus sp. KH32C]|uniref:TolC family outer membrane protein n=1 Tax=Azoarcus sp. KH32C TaxID=748247 RepID=UPI0002386D70|nr:TolC family outer membrane protein [Azoarcus sp. KH32C]BAL23869.1 hypothetical protein AZKH_1548 [Azoarcus sp. KH32C]